jgi:dihydropteroate synthase
LRASVCAGVVQPLPSYNPCVRPRYTWKLRSRSLALGERTLIMGVVNVTPDSFSDGGDFLPPERATAHALKLLEEGADILDIGGESTRPGKKQPVTADQELRRVLPVIQAVRSERPGAVLSVDTYKADVATEAMRSGVEIVNDVSAGRWDKRMPAVMAELQCGCVLMHTRGRPEEWHGLPPIESEELIKSVLSELHHAAQVAIAAGVQKEHLVLDPGFGFGKSFDENYPLLARLPELQELGFPLLSGTSRKSFIGHTLAKNGKDAPVDERINGTIASVVASILKGAHIVRVHDVAPVAEAVKVADAVLVAGG